MALVQLTHPDINSGSPVRVLCDKVTVTGSRNSQKNPNANPANSGLFELVEVQTQSVENPSLTISGIHYTGTSGTLTWDDVIILYETPYDGTASTTTTLNVTYGDSTALKLLAGTSDIKVVLDTFNLPIDARDTDKAKLPIGTLTFIETK